MKKIISLEQAVIISKKIKVEGKTTVLVGGCFDIFHRGHFQFLKKAKTLGDMLIIALESDRKVRELKGKERPITSQANRAEILNNLLFVDYVILLPYFATNQSYNNMTIGLRPDIIAATSGDPKLILKQKQAEEVGGKVVVIPYTNTPSTSKILEIINKEKCKFMKT